LGRFIYIAGADGAGKSTQTELLLESLQAQGVRCWHLWLRFPFFLSLPLLVYARWRGYSWHEVADGVDHGYWDFRESWLMRQIFPRVLFVDAMVASVFRVYLPLRLGYTMVCERYVLDMMVDLSIATQHPRLDFDRLDYFLRLLPKGALIVGMSASEPIVVARRPDLRHDQRIGMKTLAYKALFQKLGFPIVEAENPVKQTHEQILSLVGKDFSL
jgi:thymidylate kinase